MTDRQRRPAASSRSSSMPARVPERGARGVRRRGRGHRPRPAGDPAPDLPPRGAVRRDGDAGDGATRPAVRCRSCPRAAGGSRASMPPATSSRSRPASTAWSSARTRSSTSSASASRTGTCRRPSRCPVEIGSHGHGRDRARPGARAAVPDRAPPRPRDALVARGRRPGRSRDVALDRIVPVTGPLLGRRVLVVGAGRMARLVALAAARRGARRPRREPERGPRRGPRLRRRAASVAAFGPEAPLPEVDAIVLAIAAHVAALRGGPRRPARREHARSSTSRHRRPSTPDLRGALGRALHVGGRPRPRPAGRDRPSRLARRYERGHRRGRDRLRPLGPGPDLGAGDPGPERRSPRSAAPRSWTACSGACDLAGPRARARRADEPPPGRGPPPRARWPPSARTRAATPSVPPGPCSRL